MKKILAISPVATHPPDAGNRTRITHLLEQLRKHGHHVTFLFARFEKRELTATKRHWDDFHTTPAPVVFKRLLLQACNLGLSLLSPSLAIPYAVDDWYPRSLTPWLERHLLDNRYDAVVVNYVFLSKALEAFGDETLKLIDTHGRFGDRHKNFQRHGTRASWFFTTPAEEAKALARADVIIAIQDQEAGYFAEVVGGKTVITVGHSVLERSLFGHEPPEPRLLFVGSGNRLNEFSIKTFIDEAFAPLRRQFPELVLEIAGGVGTRLRRLPPGCTIVGRVPDLEAHYRLAWVVINPMAFGTGLKIKTVEALGYGKPVVTSPTGAEGLEAGAGWAFEVASTSTEFVEVIAKLIRRADERERLSHGAARFIREYNASVVAPLLDLLSEQSDTG
jgi:glycosyltransferase involved in cell wall biosynthesis